MSERDCGNDAAAYALGALEPTEAAAFERHLETCAICRDEVEAFGLVIDELPLVAIQHAPPRALRRRLMRSIRAESRAAPPARTARRRPGSLRVRPALAAIAVALVALAFAGGIELGAGGGNGPAHVIRASTGDAELTVSGGHAVLVVEHLTPPASGRIYEMWLQRGNGAPAPSTLFSVGRDGRAEIGVPGSLHGLSRVLVTDEPAQGSQAPTGKPLIVAALG